MLLWRKMNATFKKSYYSGPNVSTLLPCVFRGDQKLLRDAWYTLTNVNECLFLLIRCKYVSGKRRPSSQFKGAWNICTSLIWIDAWWRHRTGVSKPWVLNRNFLSCIHFKPQSHQTISDCPSGWCVNCNLPYVTVHLLVIIWYKLWSVWRCECTFDNLM